MVERISLAQAAKILNMAPMGLAMRMRKGLIDIGYAYSPEQTGKKTWTYDIFKAKFDKYVGEKND